MNVYTLEGAAQLIKETRIRQEGKPLCTSYHLSMEERMGIDTFLEHDTFYSELRENNVIAPSTAYSLFQTFHELCCRQEAYLQNSTREAVYRLLLCELYANSALLNMGPHKLVIATVVNEELVGLIPQEAEFKGKVSPESIRTVVVKRPLDPRLFLRFVKLNTVRTLKRLRGSTM